MSKGAVLALAALAAALVGYIWFFERTSLSSKELEQREGRVLTTFVRDRVDRLELQRKGKRVVLERKPLESGDLGSWKMLEPEAFPADQDAVDQVLGELEWLSARRELENVSAADQESFGLRAPRFRVYYRVGGERHVLSLGKLDVHGEGVYARVDSEPQAYVVPKTLTEALDHEPGHFRGKEFLGEMTVAWAQSIEISAGEQKVSLSKQDERWWFEDALRSYADEKRIDELLRALDDLRAARYLEDPADQSEAARSLATPSRVVRVRIIPDVKREDQEPRLVELRLGGVCPHHSDERVAQAGEKGPLVCVAEPQLAPFSAHPVEYRQAALLSVDASQIEAFELASGSRKLALKRAGEKWTAEGAGEVDREAVEAWLAELAQKRAEGFFAPAAFPEASRLTLKLSSGKQQVFSMSPLGPEKSVSVRRDDEPVVLRFPGTLADLLEPSSLRFKSLSLWESHQPSEVVGLEAHSGTLRQSLVMEQGSWRKTAGAPPLANDLRVREHVRSLLKLRARSFVSERPRPEHELSAPTNSLVLRLKQGELRIELGAETEHGLLARVDGGNVYEVSKDVLAKVRELAGGPAAAPEAPPASAEEAEDEFGHGADHDDHGHLH